MGDYDKKFYLLFPDIQIVNTRVHNLEWSHVRRILSVTNPNARLWYLENASTSMWSVRELDRNISTQYYERRLAAQLPANVNDLPTDKDKEIVGMTDYRIASLMPYNTPEGYADIVAL